MYISLYSLKKYTRTILYHRFLYSVYLIPSFNKWRKGIEPMYPYNKAYISQRIEHNKKISFPYLAMQILG